MILLSLDIAYAQVAPPPTPEAAPADPDAVTTLPVLVYQPAANYPTGPLAEGRGASVLLELEIDPDGNVTGVAVLTPAGEGFDEAAIEAARGFRWSPSLNAAGTPVPARLQYRYVFSAARAAVRVIEGTLRDAVSDLPFPDIEIRAVGADGVPVPARTDADGRFTFSGLEPGAYTLAVSVPGHLSAAIPVEVKAGAVLQVPVRVEPRVDAPASETVIVEAERKSPDITERTLSQEEVRFLPGTGGDVVKVVQNLPGVARAALGVGQLIIRGTAPEDSAYFLDGVSIPIVFHFSGLSTVLNGDLVGEVAYLPGNYGVRYGRALGGLVDLRTKDELPEEKRRGYVSLDLFQGTAYIEERLDDRTSLELSVRRSWVDAILSPVLSAGGSSVRAPQYWDAQARVYHKLESGGSIDILGLFSDDRFKVVGDEDDSIAIGLNTTFGKGRVTWRQPLGDWQSELTLIGGPEGQAFAFDGVPDAAFERSLRFGIREEISKPGGLGTVGWRIGADIQASRDTFQYDFGDFGIPESGETFRFAPAVYAEPSFTLGIARITPGIRLDSVSTDTGYARATADPRLSTTFSVGPTSTLKASFGRYSQFPTTRQLVPVSDLNPDADGNLALTPAWSLQSSLGFDQQLPLGFTLETTAFYNRLYDLVVGREDRLRFFSGPPPVGPFDVEPYGNVGTGRVCGIELLLRLQAENTLALVSTTFSNSVRVDRDGVSELFASDQPFVLNGLVSQELPKQWRVGTRARASSGNPYTPVINRVYDMSSRSFVPIYGERDSARLPTFWSVDARIDKEWTYDKWSLTFYVDVQNVFNTQNPEVMSWSNDYSEETPINGLPIVPAFGLRGEW